MNPCLLTFSCQTTQGRGVFVFGSGRITLRDIHFLNRLDVLLKGATNRAKIYYAESTYCLANLCSKQNVGRAPVTTMATLRTVGW